MFQVTGFGCFADDLPGQRRDAEIVLQQLCALAEAKPPAGLKHKILGRLGFESEELKSGNLPPISRYANHLSWLKAMEAVLPTAVETIFIQEICRDAQYAQTLVVTRIDVPEEAHEDYAESFLILAGRCACTIGGQVFELSAGDYLDIPLHAPHDVRLLSREVKAIIQYRFY